MPTMNISLPDGLVAFVEQEVAKGGYASQSEAVRDALRLLHQERAAEHERRALLRRAVLVGVEDWKAGRLDERPITDILDGIED